MTYTKPLVTIELAEYNELLEIKKTIEEKDTVMRKRVEKALTKYGQACLNLYSRANEGGNVAIRSEWVSSRGMKELLHILNETLRAGFDDNGLEFHIIWDNNLSTVELKEKQEVWKSSVIDTTTNSIV